MSSRRTLVLFKLQRRHLTVLRAVDESTGILVSRGLHAYASRAVLPPCTSPLQPGRSRRVALPCGGHPGLAAAQDPHNTRRRMHHCATHPLSTFPALHSMRQPARPAQHIQFASETCTASRRKAASRRSASHFANCLAIAEPPRLPHRLLTRCAAVHTDAWDHGNRLELNQILRTVMLGPVRSVSWPHTAPVHEASQYGTPQAIRRWHQSPMPRLARGPACSGAAAQ